LSGLLLGVGHLTSHKTQALFSAYFSSLAKRAVRGQMLLFHFFLRGHAVSYRFSLVIPRRTVLELIVEENPAYPQLGRIRLSPDSAGQVPPLCLLVLIELSRAPPSPSSFLVGFVSTLRCHFFASQVLPLPWRCSRVLVPATGGSCFI